MVVTNCPNNIDTSGRELIEHGNDLFPVACYNSDLALDSAPWHWHEELELLIVDGGTAEVAVSAEKWRLRSGQGIFINSGVLHGAWSANQGSCLFRSLVFHPRLVGGSVESIFWQNYLNPLLSSQTFQYCLLDGTQRWHGDILMLIQEGCRACAEEPSGYEFIVREVLSKIVFQLHGHSNALSTPVSDKALRDGERIKRMLSFIQSHLAEPLTTKQIAAQASVSVSECLRCFHSTIGSTPIQYLKQARIQEAANLLRTTDWKVAEIGAHCGFQEMSYFAKAFREQWGATPSEYRAIKRT